MKTCKDCIHCAPCGLAHDTPVSGCEWFKDQSKFIELPCAIGDTVWYIGWRQDPLQCRVSMLQQKANKSWKIRLTPPDSGVFDITLEDFNNIVFLTQKEAKNKLEECNNEKERT